MNFSSLLKENTLVKSANEIARDVHHGQRYGSAPYIKHPLQVARLANELGYQPEVIAACLLHDTIEDTEMTSEGLLVSGIPLVVVETVESVTYSSEDKAAGVDKIAKARAIPTGHVTKYCDATRNYMSTVASYQEYGPAKTRQFLGRYAGYLAQLQPDLPTPADIQEYLDARA